MCVIALQVQSDQAVSTENLQIQMSEVEKHLEVLEQRGVELEVNLRDCTNGENQRMRNVRIYYIGFFGKI